MGQHTADALAAGEQVGRIAAVHVWQESPFFTARERSALALTDSMTLAAQTHVSDADWAAATAATDPEELGALVALITTINAWNTVGVTWFDLHTGDTAPIATANWSHVENRLITRIRVTFDPRPILA